MINWVRSPAFYGGDPYEDDVEPCASGDALTESGRCPGPSRNSYASAAGLAAPASGRRLECGDALSRRAT